ncbi:MAG: oligoendopeptidase, partial [Rhodospirillaceae bacterium]|nr:oligoendopeptidase [Rhodospirillaceae bacterium]
MDDTVPKGSTADLGSLPQWDLSDLYTGPTDPAIETDLQRAAEDSKTFRQRWEGKLQAAAGDQLAEAVAAYEGLQDLLGRIGSYAQLVYAGNMTDPETARFYQTIQERLTDISADTLFFTLELNRLDDAELAAKLRAPKLAHYRPWLDVVRAFRPHQLSD